MAKLVTYAIYSILAIGIYIKSIAFLFITKLRYYPITFDCLVIKKHEMIIDMTNNAIVLWSGHYTYVRTFLSIIMD